MIVDYTNPNLYLNKDEPFSLNQEYVDFNSDTASVKNSDIDNDLSRSDSAIMKEL